MNILVSGIGGPTPRSIAATLRRQNPGVKIVGVDSNPKALGFYMSGLLDKAHIVPKAGQPGYWDAYKRIIDEEEIGMAFVQPEKEVIAWGEYHLSHGSYPCPVLLPPLEYANMLINKAAMAELLGDTDYIPGTVRILTSEPDYDLIDRSIGYPCWIRASEGSGGLGSLKLNRREDLEAWLFIHSTIAEFTVSEFLTGRHLANQMLYIDGECVKNAGLQCAEYVMADIAPSKVTGNTSYGRFLNEETLLVFCEEVMDYIALKTGIAPHGVFSFDLKEDHEGRPKLTEINVRHMAYTGIMSKVGFDLVGDTVKYLNGDSDQITRGRHKFDSDYIFLRDVDIEPIVMRDSELKQNHA